MNFQTYHAAQFHCRSSCPQTDKSPRPTEVTRDLSIRSSWIEAVIRVQKLSMNYMPIQGNIETPPEPLENTENSLLVVRYEEKVPNPEEQITNVGLSTSQDSPDSDDERLVIDEQQQKNVSRDKTKCPYCDYVSSLATTLRNHVLRHYGLKPFMCGYCSMNSTKKTVDAHLRFKHPLLPHIYRATEIPKKSPAEYYRIQESLENVKLICFVCRQTFTESESKRHTHRNEVPLFGKESDIVTRCTICRQIFKDTSAYLEHHRQHHPNIPTNYVLTKLTNENCRELVYICGTCNTVFPFIRDMKVHVKTYHSSNPIYSTAHKLAPEDDMDVNEPIPIKRKAVDIVELAPIKRVARKSTTKLPFTKTCARKSTTKLPFNVLCESKEFSYYGTKPVTDGLEDVTVMMPFCNTVVDFTLKKLKGIINIDPKVLVTALDDKLVKKTSV